MDKDKIILREDLIVKPFSLVVDDIPITLYSLNGKIYTDERAASYDNYTHDKCNKCGEIIRKNSYCSPCADKKEIENFEKMPVKKYDNTWPIFSIAADEYFFDEESLVDHSLESGVSIDSLMLTDCFEDRPRELEMDHFNDGLYEEFENSELENLIDEFNENAKNILLGYTPGNHRIVFSDDFNDYVDIVSWQPKSDGCFMKK